MLILGIGGVLGDAASAVLKDGEIVAAVEESKLARRGHRKGELPEQSMAACLAIACAQPATVDCVAIVRPVSAGAETNVHLQLRAKFPNSRLVQVEHHAAHAASAFFASLFDEATVLTLDRTGDSRCGARWQGAGNRLTLDSETYYPDSLGDLYGRVTELLGFSPNADEHKVQWLSVQGEESYRGLFLKMLNVRNGDWPRIDRSYFETDRMTRGGFSSKFFEQLGLKDDQEIPASMRGSVARGIQSAVEVAVSELGGSSRNLCLAGGLGLNALLVAALERQFDVFVQPASGNAGTAIGAVLHAWHSVYHQTRRVSLGNLFTGPGYGAEEIKQVLENCKLRFRYLLTTQELLAGAVAQLNEHKIVAWMHGRMEFGPRALGNRSILASPLDPYSTENLNAYIKHRESFRKFAASVPAELASEYFEVGPNARYLATVGRVRPAHRKRFETAVLAGDLIRVHTVREEDNPLYWKLLHAAGESTGLPVLYNTSFNLFGEPLVCTPRDAVRSFYSSGIDALFVGNFFLQK